MTRRYVLDANTVVSAALLTASVPRQALEEALDRGTVLLSPQTVAELERVLSRPKLDRYVTESYRLSFMVALAQPQYLSRRRRRTCRPENDLPRSTLARPGSAKWVLAFFLAGMTAASGCLPRSDFDSTPPPADDVLRDNAIRMKVGVRPVGPTWCYYGKEFGFEKWKVDCEKPLGKCVTRTEKGDLKCDTDIYYSGHQYRAADDGSLADESMSVVYDYRDNSARAVYCGTNEVLLALERRSPSMTACDVLLAVDEVVAGWSQ
jgi:predicted nucleic acid-binding protein